MPESLQKLTFRVIAQGFTGMERSLTALNAKIEQLNTTLAGGAKGVATMADGTAKLGQQTQKTTGFVQRLGRAIRTTFAYGLSGMGFFALFNALRSGVTAIFEFDQALHNLKAITQSTQEQVDLMGKKILEVAANTKFSATEVSDAMVTLGQAGFSATESINTIDAVAGLAAGTLSSLETTVDLVTTAIRAFGLSTSDSAHVADVFASAVNASKLTIDKIRIAFNYIGPIARKAGVSLEETATAASLLANAGIRASTIGTGLRQVISRLVKPTGALTKALEEAGLTYEQINPQITDFREVLSNLVEIVPTATEAYRLFGIRGATAIAVLTQQGVEGFDRMSLMINRAGMAAAMSEEQLKGLALLWKNVKDRAQVFAVTLGNLVTPALRSLFEAFKSLLSGMTEFASSLGGKILISAVALAGAIKLLVAASVLLSNRIIAVLVPVITTASYAFAGAGANATFFTRALAAMRAVLVSHPIFLLATAVAGIVAAITLLGDKGSESIETYAEKVEGLNERINQLNQSVSYVENAVSILRNSEASFEEKQRVISLLSARYRDLGFSVARTTNNMRDETDVVEDAIEAGEQLIENLGEQKTALLGLRLQAVGNEMTRLKGNVDDLASGYEKFQEHIKRFNLDEAFGITTQSGIEGIFDTMSRRIPELSGVISAFGEETDYDFATAKAAIDSFRNTLNTSLSSAEADFYNFIGAEGELMAAMQDFSGQTREEFLAFLDVLEEAGQINQSNIHEIVDAFDQLQTTLDQIDAEEAAENIRELTEAIDEAASKLEDLNWEIQLQELDNQIQELENANDDRGAELLRIQKESMQKAKRFTDSMEDVAEELVNAMSLNFPGLEVSVLEGLDISSEEYAAALDSMLSSYVGTARDEAAEAIGELQDIWGSLQRALLLVDQWRVEAESNVGSATSSAGGSSRTAKDIERELLEEEIEVRSILAEMRGDESAQIALEIEELQRSIPLLEETGSLYDSEVKLIEAKIAAKQQELAQMQIENEYRRQNLELERQAYEAANEGDVSALASLELDRLEIQKAQLEAEIEQNRLGGWFSTNLMERLELERDLARTNNEILILKKEQQLTEAEIALKQADKKGLSEEEKRQLQERVYQLQLELATLRGQADEVARINSRMQELANSGDIWGNVLNHINEQIKTTNQILEEATVKFIDGFGNAAGEAFTGFIKGTQSAQEAFREFAEDMLSYMAKMIAKQLVMNMLQSIFGGIGGGKSGKGFSIMSLFGFHGGGSPKTGRTFRVLNNTLGAVGAALNTFHSGKSPGLGTDEALAVIRQNETVLTPDQMNAMNNQQPVNFTINVENKASDQTEVSMRRPRFDGARWVADMTIEAKNRGLMQS